MRPLLAVALLTLNLALAQGTTSPPSDDPREPPYNTLLFRSQTVPDYDMWSGYCDSPAAARWIEMNHPDALPGRFRCYSFVKADLDASVRALQEDLQARGYVLTPTQVTHFSSPGGPTEAEGVMFRADLATSDLVHDVNIAVGRDNRGVVLLVERGGMTTP